MSEIVTMTPRSHGQSDKPSRLDALWVEPDKVGKHWDHVKAGLEEVAKHGDGWRVEDIYTAVKNGTAVMHMFFDGTKYIAVCVTTEYMGNTGKILHVWALHSSGQNQAYHDMVFAQLDEWAKNISAEKITFHSPRKGWEKVGQKHGYTPSTVIYEKVL